MAGEGVESHATPPYNVPPSPLRTERTLLRCWGVADAPAFKAALDASLPEMRPWIPWARDEPSRLEDLARRLEGYRRDFHEGRNALYGIFDPDDGSVLGGVGLYRRVGPGAIEIGYWIRSDQAGRGLATETARCLTEVGLALPEVERVEIHCDARNAPSAAIPRKLGYELAAVREVGEPDGPVRRSQTWVATRPPPPPDSASSIDAAGAAPTS